ncbi:MAG: hypothetical protein EAY75_14725 [Bacteroidetes bacterium]|nr:MAG: hypothetical protein EAY75_14725 [Bacteroidota bacterium]
MTGHTTISRWASSIVLVLMCLPCGVVMVLGLRSAWLQHHAEERMEKASLTRLVLASHQVYWVRQGKELLVGQHYFDVKSQQSVDAHHVAFIGIFDHQETRLHLALQALTTPQRQCQQQVATLFFTCALPGARFCWAPALLALPPTHWPPHGPQAFASTCMPVPTPPPLAG